MKKKWFYFLIPVLVLAILLGIGALVRRSALAQTPGNQYVRARAEDLPLPEGEIVALILEDPAWGSETRVPRHWTQRWVTDPAEIEAFLTILRTGLEEFYPHRTERIPDGRTVDEHAARAALFTGDESLCLELRYVRNGELYLYFPGHGGSWHFSRKGEEALLAFLSAHPQRELSDPAEYGKIRLLDPIGGGEYDLTGADFEAAVQAVASVGTHAAKHWGGVQTDGPVYAVLEAQFADGGELTLSFAPAGERTVLFEESQSVHDAQNAPARPYCYFTLTETNNTFAPLMQRLLEE